MSTRIHMLAPLLGVILALILPERAWAQLPEGMRYTDEVVSASVVPPPPPPRVRSLDIPGAMNEAAAVTLPALAAGDTVGAEGQETPLIVGRIHEFMIGSGDRGTWTDLPDGGKLWSLAFVSPDAKGLRIRLERFDPPTGSELIVLNLDHKEEAYGPVRGRSVPPEPPLWTPAVFGNRVGLELYVPPGAAPAKPEFLVTGAALRFPSGGEQAASGCKLDVTCYPAWAVTANSVAHIEFIKDSSWYICSGAMITRYWGDDFSRLFMTASHCINDQTVAGTVQAYWFFQTSVCNGVAPPLSSCPRTVGSVYMRSDAVADITILGLTGDVPSGLTWAGWDASEAPDPTPATVIHHPEGARKSISWGNLKGLPWWVPCVSPIDDAYDMDFDDGGQEGGSSGAPVFDSAYHRIRAVVSCSDDGCSPTEHAHEGALCKAWDEVWTVIEGWDHVWVDIAHTGTELGNEPYPWKTITKGSFAVMAPGIVHIKAGTYPAMTLPSAPGDGRVITYKAEYGTVVIGQ